MSAGVGWGGPHLEPHGSLFTQKCQVKSMEIKGWCVFVGAPHVELESTVNKNVRIFS